MNELLGCTGSVREPGTSRCEGQCVRSRAACFSCVRRRASNAILHESAGQRHAGECVAGAMNDHRGPAHHCDCPDAREPCVRSLRWPSRTQTTRQECLERNAGLLRYTCELVLCNLTSELSRVAARPQIGQAVAAKCAAAKQRRLERTVRLQCATKGTTALRKQRPRSLTSRRVGERKTIGAKDLAEAWPRGQ